MAFPGDAILAVKKRHDVPLGERSAFSSGGGTDSHGWWSHGPAWQCGENRRFGVGQIFLDMDIFPVCNRSFSEEQQRFRWKWLPGNRSILVDPLPGGKDAIRQRG